MPPETRSKTTAFTIVELLVVIGIVTLLIAILMPALSKVRKHAQEVHCAANLRSIGHALTMYTGAYGCYPGCSIVDTNILANYAVWPVRLRPFLGGHQGVFLCPARDERFEWPKVPPEPGGAGRAGEFHARFGYEPGEPLLSFVRRPFSYGYNAWGVSSSLDSRGLGAQVSNMTGAQHPSHPRWWHEIPASRVKSPSQMIAITDSDGDGMTDFRIFAMYPTVIRTPSQEAPGTIHRGGANVLFCDGHVQWYSQKRLQVPDNGYLPEHDPIRRMWNTDNQP